MHHNKMQVFFITVILCFSAVSFAMGPGFQPVPYNYNYQSYNTTHAIAYRQTENSFPKFSSNPEYAAYCAAKQNRFSIDFDTKKITQLNASSKPTGLVIFPGGGPNDTWGPLSNYYHALNINHELVVYNLEKCSQLYNGQLGKQFDAKLDQIDQALTKIDQVFNAILNPYNHPEKLLDFVSLTIPEPTLNKIWLDAKNELCSYLFDKNGNPLIPHANNDKSIQKCIENFKDKVHNWLAFKQYTLENELKKPTPLHKFLPLKNIKNYEKIVSNKANIDLLKVRDLCSQGRFEQAHQIVAEYGKSFFGKVRNSQSSNEFSIMSNIYQNAFGNLYDEHGISRRYYNDPQYRKLAETLPYSDIPTANNALDWEKRAEAKDVLLGQVSLRSSPQNDLLAYTILDFEKDGKHDAAVLSILPLNNYRDWCTKEGLPKWHSKNGPASRISLPSKIVESNHVRERQTFYLLSTLDTAHEFHAQAYKQGITLLEKSLSNDINGKVYGALAHATAIAAKYEATDKTILKCSNFCRDFPDKYKEVAAKAFPIVANYVTALHSSTQQLSANEKYELQKCLLKLDEFYGALHDRRAEDAIGTLKQLAQQVENDTMHAARFKNEDLPSFHQVSHLIKSSQQNTTQPATIATGFTLVSPDARFAPTKNSSSQATEFNSQFRNYEFSQQRIDAHKGNTELFSVTYELTKNGLQLLKSNNINPESFTKLTGNSLQHEMQLELVDVLNQTGKFDVKANSETKVITSGIAHTANAANHFKIQKEYAKAAVLISFCKNTVVYLEAAGSGLMDAGKDFGHHLWNQPLETLGRLGMNLIPANRLVTVYRMGRFAMEAIKFDLSQVPHIDNQELTFGKIKTGIHDAVIALSEKLYHLTTPDGIRKLTKAGASLVIEYKAANAMQNCVTAAANKMNLLQGTIKLGLPAPAQQRTPIAVTPEGIEIFHPETNNNNYFKNDANQQGLQTPIGSKQSLSEISNNNNQLLPAIKDVQAIQKIEQIGKINNVLLLRAIQKEQEFLQKTAGQPRTLELVKEQLANRVARLEMQYGKENVKEAINLFNINDKTLIKNVELIDRLELTAKKLQIINSNPRWILFKFDPASGGSADLGTIDETITAIACIESGLISKLERSAHAGADFIEKGTSKNWDVKTPHHSAINGKKIFSAKEWFDHSIKRTLIENPHENLIIDIMYLPSDEAKNLNTYLNQLSIEDLNRIIVIDSKTILNL